jgi:hypothetical protein
MTKTEITTIATALKDKKTWVKKGFNDLLNVWKDITEDMDVGKVYIGKRMLPEYIQHTVYLVSGEKMLFFIEEDTAYGEMEEMDYYFNRTCDTERDSLSSELIRWAAPRITEAITRHFKALQDDIDNLSVTGREIRRITDCLSK